MYFAFHADVDPDEAWQATRAVYSRPNSSDDHINMKSDSTGRLFAVVKTSHTVSSEPFIVLLVHDPSTGAWASHSVSQVADKHTRPILVLDEANQRIHVLVAAGQAGGTIYRKTSPMDPIGFRAGKGEVVINDGNQLRHGRSLVHQADGEHYDGARRPGIEQHDRLLLAQLRPAGRGRAARAGRRVLGHADFGHRSAGRWLQRQLERQPGQLEPRCRGSARP